jgi:hypothetical protein
MPGFDSGFMRGLSCEEKIYREDRKLLGIRDLRTILPQPPWATEALLVAVVQQVFSVGNYDSPTPTRWLTVSIRSPR